MSRGSPEFGKERQGTIPFIRHRQWKRRCRWAKQLNTTKNYNETKQHEADEKLTQQNCVVEDHVAGEITLTAGKQASAQGNSDVIPQLKARGKNSGKVCDVNSTAESDDDIKTNRTFDEVKNRDDSDVKKTHNTDKDIVILDSAEEDSGSKVVENPSCMDITKDNKSVEYEPKGTAQLNNLTNTNEQNSDTTVECRGSKHSGTTVKRENNVTNEGSAGEYGQSAVDESEGRMLLVLPDSDSDYEQYLDNVCPRLEKEQFPVHETLHLTLEEAFFLSFGLGCLQVVDLFGNCLPLDGVWQLFCKSQKDFVQKYVAYHYFRSKGWVVKPGIKFGGDFRKFDFSCINFSIFPQGGKCCLCLNL